MIEATQEMREVFERIGGAAAFSGQDGMTAGIQAVLNLIDPIPDDVGVIKDKDGERWFRDVFDPLLWNAETYGDHSIQYIIREYGPITWEGRS